MPEPLRHTTFTPLLDEMFAVPLQDEALHLTLVEVKDLGFGADEENARRAFSLLFRHERTDAYLPQGTYKMENSTLGEVFLFLAPLGPRQDGMYYESVFT